MAGLNPNGLGRNRSFDDTESDSLSTEELSNNIIYAGSWSGATGHEKITNALNSVGSAPSTLVIDPQGPDSYSADNGDEYDNIWLFDDVVEVPSNTLIKIQGDIVMEDMTAQPFFENSARDTSDARNENIHIVGENQPQLDQRAAHQGRDPNGDEDPDYVGLAFYKVDGLTVEGINLINTVGWAARIENVTDLSVNTIWFDQDGAVANQDGIHIVGPCESFEVDGLHGDTHDDVLALSAESESLFTDGAAGDVTQGTISNITAIAKEGVPPSTVKFVMGQAGVMRNISVSDIVVRSKGGINFWDYGSEAPLGAARSINISNIVVAGGVAWPFSFNSSVTDVTINNVRGVNFAGVTPTDSVVRIMKDVEDVTISDVDLRTTDGTKLNQFIETLNGSTADNLTLSDIYVRDGRGDGTFILQNQTSGGFTNADWRDIEADGFDTMFAVTDSDGRVKDATATNVGTIYDSVGSLKFVGDNPAFDSPAPSVKGSEVIASSTWDPDSDGNAEKVFYDGTAWQEVVDLPNF